MENVFFERDINIEIEKKLQMTPKPCTRREIIKLEQKSMN